MSRRKRFVVPLVVALLGGGALAAHLVHGVVEPSSVSGVALAPRPISGQRESSRRARDLRPPKEGSELSSMAEPDTDRTAPLLSECARTASEVERLTKAVGLTEQQRGRAAKIVSVVEHARSMVARDQDQDDDARRAREQQIDQQERLALLAVVTVPQQSLLDSYFRRH